MARRRYSATVATVDELLERARARLRRVTPAEAARRRRQGALLIDLRILEQRTADGTVPGAEIISLNHIEWRLDPASASRIAAARNHDVEIILFCDEGYVSSLAAARLHELGLHRATDVIGGFQAWRTAELPVEATLPIEGLPVEE
jgi:rhodanese-related sulfurtransferase